MSPSDQPTDVTREVQFEHSRDFVDILKQTNVSLLVSTYQAGKLVVLGTDSNGLSLAFHNFDKAMGIAVHPQQIAVGAATQIWLLRSAPKVIEQMGPDGTYDGCYLTRASHVTEEIHVHEMEWCNDELWFANTRFSCLCTLHDDFSFAPRWRPQFITELQPEDRCHLNGLCTEDGRPKYVTAMAETDTPAGWRPVKSSGGCLIDVASGEAVARGFVMPHSPRVHDGRVWVLDSGRGQMTVLDPSSGRFEPVTQQPGYTRGLGFAGPFAFIGLSRIRETSTFGGVPIAEHSDQLKCAVAVVDLRSGRRVAYFEFLSGVEEIFDVRVLPGVRNPCITGPHALVEGAKTVWYVPNPTPDVSYAKSGTGAGGLLPAADSAAETGPPIPKDALELCRRGEEHAGRDAFEQAAECFDEAVAIHPSFAEALCNLGLAQQFLGRIDESIHTLGQSLAVAPNSPVTHMNLAMSWFLNGRLARAWHEYEWRWKCARFGDRPADIARMAPAWDGSSLAGRTLLVYGEQGVGDEIMFASCVPELIDEAAHCIVTCDSRLVPLFRRSFPAARVVSRADAGGLDRLNEIEPFPFQVAAGSVPRYLRPTVEHFPRQPSYLVADPGSIEQWRNRLVDLGPGKYVGISWKGGKEPEERRRRSTMLEQWAGLFDVAGVQFVNLQYGDCADELKEVKNRFGVTIHDWLAADPLDDIDSLASQIAALDLVISIDNSTIHLTGALGVPTWAMLSFPSSSYWRWLLDGKEAVWYPSLQLFRRRHPEDWKPVFREVREQLSQFAQS